MELLRIVAMLMIILHHANYWSLGAVGQADIQIAPAASILRMLIEQACTVGVNVFILISGWFGIRPSLKGALSILYQVFFYGVIILLAGMALGSPVPVKDVLYVFWGGGYYWFVTAYLGLYCFSPVLNAFVEKASPRSFKIVLAAFFIMEFALGWLTDLGSYNSGYSMVSFMGLYLLARYISIHCNGLKELGTRKCLIIYALATIIPLVGTILGPRYLNHNFSPYDYCSPFVIVASISLLVAFSRIQIKSKFINWTACSVFSVYLVHQHPMVAPYFKSFVQGVYSRMDVFSYFAFALAFAILILLVCVLIDKARIWSWHRISNAIASRSCN